MREKQRLSARW